MTAIVIGALIAVFISCLITEGADKRNEYLRYNKED